MAFSIRTWRRFEFKDSAGVMHTGGSSFTDQPKTQTMAGGESYDRTFSVTSSSIQLLFDVANSDLSTFEFMYIESDQDGMVEFITDDNASSGELYQPHEIKAGKPYMIDSDSALSGSGSAKLFNGAADVIEAVRYKNTTSTTANVRCVAAR
jgi:hypothetical protein